MLCLTFPLKSSSHNKLSNRNDVVDSKSEFISQTNNGAMKDGSIRKPIFGDTNTVILSNSDGNKILKTTFYRFVERILIHILVPMAHY